MMFKTIFEKLEQAENPVFQLVQDTADSKVIAIAFKKGMLLKPHTTAVPARLIVFEGKISYNEDQFEQLLLKHEEHNIPSNIAHWVKAEEDSLCLLFKP